MTERDFLILEYSKEVFFCQDMFAFICGEKISSGQFRDVFDYNMDPKFVVKIQKESGNFSNILEFELWNYVKGTPYGKYFAPCSWISGNGRILLQRKTKPITKTRKAPDYIPSFFLDVKDENFGFIGTQFVAHDYDFSVEKLVSAGLNNRTKKYKPHTK